MHAKDIINSRIEALDIDNKIRAAKEWIKEQGFPQNEQDHRLGISFDVSVCKNSLFVEYDWKDRMGNGQRILDTTRNTSNSTISRQSLICWKPHARTANT